MIKSFFDISFFQAFIADTLATIIGVAAGIPIALSLNRYFEHSSEVEHKKKILLVISNEISFNKSELDNWEKVALRKIPGLPPKLRYEAWKAFSDGGEIQWIKDPELLGTIAETYYFIRQLLELTEKNFEITYLSRPLHESNVGPAMAMYVNNEISPTTYNRILNTLDIIEKLLKT